jgi:hypothetical protein
MKQCYKEDANIWSKKAVWLLSKKKLIKSSMVINEKKLMRKRTRLHFRQLKLGLRQESSPC